MDFELGSRLMPGDGMEGDDDANAYPLSQVACQKHDPMISDHAQRTPVRAPRQGTLALDAAGNAPMMRRRGKIFSDPVHNTFRMSSSCVAIIDTQQFQRLRCLHQLGTAHYVFPGAVHTRFEHSVGTAHLAEDLATHLIDLQHLEQRQRKGCVVEDYGAGADRSDIELVTHAGLCHDLGHGAFSHVWEHGFVKRMGLANWKHEDMSGKMLDYLIDDNQIDCISAEDVTRIKELIRGAPFGANTPGGGPAGSGANSSLYGRWAGKRFLFDIVANQRNSIDVDKLDYLQRDALMCNVRPGCDFKRLVLFSKVIGDEVCYKSWEYNTLYELFQARASMHRKVYQHRKVKAIEFMIVDALVEADRALGIQERAWDAEQFMAIDDNLLSHIEHFNAFFRGALEADAAAGLERAQAIIANLRKRKLYKYCNELRVPERKLADGSWASHVQRQFTEEVVAAFGSYNGQPLNAADFIVNSHKIDLTNGGANPLDKVSFFDDLDSTETRHISGDQMPGLKLSFHQEVTLRAYVRKPELQDAVINALDKWAKQYLGSEVKMATPMKRASLQVAAGGASGSGGYDLGNPLALGVLPREAALAGAAIGGSAGRGGSASASGAGAGGSATPTRTSGSASISLAGGLPHGRHAGMNLSAVKEEEDEEARSAGPRARLSMGASMGREDEVQDGHMLQQQEQRTPGSGAAGVQQGAEEEGTGGAAARSAKRQRHLAFDNEAQ